MDEKIKISENSASEKLINERIKKIDLLRSKGIDPYPSTYNRTHLVGQGKEKFKSLENEFKDSKFDTEEFAFSGRVMSIRSMGKALFFDIKDKSDQIQCFARKNNLGKNYEILECLDIGDILGVIGPLIRTRRG